MNDVRVELSHVTKSFGRPVLADINLKMEQGDFVSVIGKSGSGKSTLMNIIGLVENYDNGEYCINGVKIENDVDYAKVRLENIGFIFQNYNLIPTLTCKENILMPTYFAKGIQATAFDELVEKLDLSKLLEQRVNVLSGGEKQRVAIARSLILNPGLLIADEPTGNLDPENKTIIMDLLKKENESGRSIVLITHDMEVSKIATKEYELRDGVLRQL